MVDQPRHVAVDLDGVLAQYDGWQGVDRIGDPIRGARLFMVALREAGYTVIVHTTRAAPHPFGDGLGLGEAGGAARDTPARLAARICEWLARWDIPYDHVWSGEGKPVAVAYVDDRSVPCRPQKVEAGEEAAEFLRVLDWIELLK